jgi:hypothetical protein
MTPASTFLHTLAELKPTGTFPQRVLVRDPSASATVEMDVNQFDSLACQITMLRVTPDVAVSAPLKDRATLVAGRATGLMEKLNVIEVDNDRGEALLRSDTPAARDQDRFYYEVVLQRKGVATLQRYQGSLVKPERKVVPFTVTREALSKLVADLVK